MTEIKKIKRFSLFGSEKQVQAKIIYVQLFIIAIVVLLLAYWYLVPVQVIKINKLPIPVTSPENIKSGRVIVLTFDYCKYKDIRGKVERQLVSERLVLDMPSYQETTDVGCGKIDSPTILPYTVATQRFHIHYKILYPVNPLRTEVVEFDTAEFAIFPIPTTLDGNAVMLDEGTGILTNNTAQVIPTAMPTLQPRITEYRSISQAQISPAPQAGNSASTNVPTPTPMPTPKQIVQAAPTPFPTPVQIIQAVINQVKQLISL